MKKNTSIILIISLILLITSACSSSSTSNPTPLTTPTNAISENLSGYPGFPTSSAEMAYPGPASDFPTALPSGILPNAPNDAPQPEEGNASISGVLFSYTTHTILPQTMYYLTPGRGTNKDQVPSVLYGPNKDIGDISGMTDAEGIFNINNIPPGKYYLIVQAPMNWAIADSGDQDQTPRMIQLDAGEKLPLGIVYVPWP